MLGVDFRIYLQCDTCKAVFLHKTELPPAEAFVVCANCSSVCSGISYPRAVGIREGEEMNTLSLQTRLERRR
jgi:hypothetical protein